jgi:hypothetical protein
VHSSCTSSKSSSGPGGAGGGGAAGERAAVGKHRGSHGTQMRRILLNAHWRHRRSFWRMSGVPPWHATVKAHVTALSCAAGGTTATTTGPFAAVANGEPLNDATGKATADGRTTAAGGAAAQGSVDGRSSSEAAKAAPAVPAQAAETPLLAAGVVEAQPAVTHFSGASVISYIKVRGESSQEGFLLRDVGWG